MTDIRSRADAYRKTETHNKLAVELHRDPDFDFVERRLVRLVANEAFDLQSRVGHIFRLQDKIEWGTASLSDLRSIIERTEYIAKTAREILEAQESEPVPFQQAAE